jgi:serine phosphatase RsbU (regulator of sigma subunit)
VATFEQIRPKRSIGFKLLVGAAVLVGSLLLTAIGIAFPLLTEDSRNFAFELQATQTRLLGAEFSAVAQSTLETSRGALANLPSANNFKPGSSFSSDRAASLRSQLNNQDSVLDFEAFYIPGIGQPAEKLFAWRSDRAKALTFTSLAPNEMRLKELYQLGVSYLAKPSSSGKPEIHMFLTEKPGKGAEQKGLVVTRALLDMRAVHQKAKGTYTQILDNQGQILVDSVKAAGTGGQMAPENPLYKAAKESMVQVGTLEFMDNTKKEMLFGAFAIPGYNTLVLSSIRKIDAFRATYQLLERLILTGLLLLGIALILVVLFSIGLSRPIAELTEATYEISEGNFSLRLDERSTDEIGILSRSMNSMSAKIQDLLLESIKKVKIEQEIAIAATLQQNLIPPNYIDQPHFSLHSTYQSAAECGGDWWGYVESKDHVSVIIADATGHGLPAAMLTASARGCFSVLQKLLQDFPRLPAIPSFLLSCANRAIIESTQSQLNMTMFIASYSITERTLSYASAGHNPGYLISTGEQGLELKQLRARGERLGENVDYPMPKTETIDIKPGDRILLYTDGLTDNMDRFEQTYGKDRLQEVLSTSSDTTAKGLTDALNADIEKFYEGITPGDDVTFVILETKEA